MNNRQDNSTISIKDKEATTKPRQEPDSRPSKTVVSLGDNRWKYHGKTYQEQSLSSSIESYPQNFSPSRRK